MRQVKPKDVLTRKSPRVQPENQKTLHHKWFSQARRVEVISLDIRICCGRFVGPSHTANGWSPCFRQLACVVQPGARTHKHTQTEALNAVPSHRSWQRLPPRFAHSLALSLSLSLSLSRSLFPSASPLPNCCQAGHTPCKPGVKHRKSANQLKSKCVATSHHSVLDGIVDGLNIPDIASSLQHIPQALHVLPGVNGLLEVWQWDFCLLTIRD